MNDFSKTAYFTICSLNYLPTAKILLETLQKNTVNEIFLIVCDKKTDLGEFLSDLNVTPIFVEDLSITDFNEFLLRFSILELNTSIKPFVFNFLFNKGFEKVFYFDPDISIESPLNKFEDILDSYDALVTPHILSPYRDEMKPGLREISDSGIYNLGFLGLKSLNTETFLKWWMYNCQYYCYSDVESGLFTDQKFCNYLPVFIEKTKIYHGAEANIAYWNLHEREISEKNGVFLSNDREVLFFHFSGIVYDKNFKFKYLSKHENRYKSEVPNDLANKINKYLEQLSLNTKLFKKLGINDKYSLDEIDEISLDSYTRAYIKEIEKKEIQYKFSDIDKNWFFRVSKELENPYELNRYFFGIYFSRKDLHQVFNINKRSGLDDFLRWVNNEIVLGNLHTNLLKYIPDDIKIDNRSSLVRKFILRVSKFLLRKYPFFFTNALVAKFKNFIKRLFFKNYLKKTKSIENKLRLFSKKELPLEKREGFNVFGYFKESTGLAVGANLMTEMLKEAKFKVSKNIVDISDNSIISEEFVNQKIWDISLFHINADQTPNLFPALQKKYLDTFRIGYWAWELERFPSNYLKSGEYLNDLWVPSRFIAESIERSCNFEPKVIPHPVKEHSKNKSNLDKRFDIKDRFVVTGIMDLNSYAERKNPSGILKAFSDACIDKSFRKDAVLVLKLSGSFKKREVLQKINSYKEKHKSQIVVIDEIFSEKEMEGLRNITDVFISLHRSEGFGLNLIENMNAGNLVIATNYSGNKDFMNEKNSLLVDFKMIPVREGDYPEWEGQFWADPSIKDAAEKLIWSFKNHSESDKISKYAKSFINKNFSISKISNDVLKATKSIK